MYTGASTRLPARKRCCKMGIRLLDDKLINKIAAGEVIERPASIVKELVENAIDAGSTIISVSIAGGGIDRIEITDNGSGIPNEEVPMAFKRHATSKIAREDDLFNIHTMGFRGEALPSIASISKLEMYTQYGSQSGVKAVMEGGREPELEAYPTAPGTRIIVRDVFFNTPARKKFLKSPVAEGVNIHDVMTRLALARPDISFSFANEKKLYFKTPGNGSLRDTAAAIYGGEYTEIFIDLEWSGAEYNLRGLISKPEFPRANRKNQLFFVNHRWIKSPMLARAVDEGYRGLLVTREYPAVFLYLDVPESEVDVNVHPQKAEVKFREEKVIFRMVNHAIKDTLGKSSPMEAAAAADRYVRPTPFGSMGTPAAYKELLKTPARYIEESTLALDYGPISSVIPADQKASRLELPFEENGLAVIGQCFDSYILVENGQELWLIDQHAAHERIMFNRLVENTNNNVPQSQVLVFPLVFDVSSTNLDLLEEKQPVLREIGFDIEAIGPNAAIIRSAPPLLQGREIEVVNECLELWEDERQVDINREILAMIACKQAVKAEHSLSRQEMAMLVNDLVQTEDFKNCPHGRPTIIKINRMELDKRFKRK